ncbi:MAG: phosphoribosylaminoimidazole carboxylase ade2 [Trizodia sp. TS-e1964]|nr:MAG: phosphoribosylaminoimidazole carboxylase ade2 [Trizodia sp. TS-e1964]
MATTIVLETSIPELPLISRGKVRDLYQINDDTLLFISTDRISSHDVNLKNGVPNKGAILNLISAHWFRIFADALPSLRTHVLAPPTPPLPPSAEKYQREQRCMPIRACTIFPIEAIVRGYLAGSAWKEYRAAGTVHGIQLPAGLQEFEQIPGGPIYTPSTKAAAGQHDENIHPDRVPALIGAKHAQAVEEAALSLYKIAHAHALTRGLILADTKFEFGHCSAAAAADDDDGALMLVDEAVTPDSSRFWLRDSHGAGRMPQGFDKQYLRDWLVGAGLQGKEGVEIPADVLEVLVRKYREVFRRLLGHEFGVGLRS